MRQRIWTTDLISLGRGAHRDVQQVLREAQQHGGWSGTRVKSGHIQLRHAGGGTVGLGSTTSDHRALANSRASIRRAESAAA